VKAHDPQGAGLGQRHRLVSHLDRTRHVRDLDVRWTSGTGQVGMPLVCAAGVWGATSSVAVAWQRDGGTIGGQTGLPYTPTAADLGSTITCTSSARLPANAR
jgi:hypothetical protein